MDGLNSRKLKDRSVIMNTAALCKIHSLRNTLRIQERGPFLIRPTREKKSGSFHHAVRAGVVCLLRSDLQFKSGDCSSHL